MDRDRLAVIVEDDNLEEPASLVSADVQVALSSTDHTYGLAYRVFDVEVGDTVLAAASAISTYAGYLAWMSQN